RPRVPVSADRGPGRLVVLHRAPAARPRAAQVCELYQISSRSWAASGLGESPSFHAAQLHPGGAASRVVSSFGQVAGYRTASRRRRSIEATQVKSKVPMEIELKFKFAPEALGSMLAHPALQGQEQFVRLRSTYFDTPDRLLRRAGLGLRVRDTGAGFLQTIK